MRPKIIVVGCGVVGAVVAYELSRQIAAEIVVLDRRSPAQGSTGAALGVLMGIISGRVKGRTWRLREASINRYHSLIQELAEAGESVPFNDQGLVSLCFDEEKLPRWQTLKEKRQAQGYPLEIWTPQTLQLRCPHIDLESSVESDLEPSSTELRTVKAAIYSPMDAQVHSVDLTQALVRVATASGVNFIQNAEVTQLVMDGPRCVGVQTTQGNFEADWVVLSAGLGSAALTRVGPERVGPETATQVSEPLDLMPVLGQAMEIQLPEVLGHADFQPVINGDDIQFVPLGEGRYWLGATVEFPPEEWLAHKEAYGGNADNLFAAEAEGLANLGRGAERFCSAVSQAKVLNTWSGLRPRPVGQPAPVIKPLGTTANVTLATGHYRNGVLLAPATALQVCELLRANALFS
ncbi:MAG: FAD-dependent oxidoreductase [Cyanobacteria bacterium P01_F01_bin.53]